jgi:type IV secretion system protein VirB5
MKPFFKPEKDAKPSYVEARGSFNEMYATHYYAAKKWFLVSMIEAVALVVLLAGFVFLALQSRVVPYAVEFNEHGESVRVRRVDEMAQPNEAQIRAALRSWLVGSRTVYVDRRAQKNLFDVVYAMTLPGSSAYKTLYDYHTINNPYEISEKETREVIVNSIRPIPDSATWLIEWTETNRDRSGRVIDTRVWQGSVAVAIVPPTDEKQIFVNPIGMYVEQFSWGQRQ